MKPQLTFAPDLYHNKLRTIQLAEQFRTQAQKALPAMRLGFIPQGINGEEIADAWFTQGVFYDVIGLAFKSARTDAIHIMGKRGLYYNVHMLGVSYMEDIRCWPRYIQSLDTSKPIKMAYYGKDMTTVAPGMGLLLPGCVVEDTQLMINNIMELRALCA